MVGERERERERENIWRGVEEEQDAVFLECPLRLCRSRDHITDAWAKVEKVKRSPDEHRYIFWFAEYDEKGVEHQRIWYIQGLDRVGQKDAGKTRVAGAVERVDDPTCPAYHVWFQRDAIFSDTQEGYHVRVKFKCFDSATQLDTVRFVGTVIMSYVLDKGALFLFFLDTPQGEGKIVGVAGVQLHDLHFSSRNAPYLPPVPWRLHAGNGRGEV